MHLPFAAVKLPRVVKRKRKKLKVVVFLLAAEELRKEAEVAK
jgi:hypothetical protein